MRRNTRGCRKQSPLLTKFITKTPPLVVSTSTSQQEKPSLLFYQSWYSKRNKNKMFSFPLCAHFLSFRQRAALRKGAWQRKLGWQNVALHCHAAKFGSEARDSDPCCCMLIPVASDTTGIFLHRHRLYSLQDFRQFQKLH